MQNESETPEGEDMDESEAQNWILSEKKRLITALQPPSGRGEKKRKKKEDQRLKSVWTVKCGKHCQKVRTTHKPRKNKIYDSGMEKQLKRK